MKNYDVIILGAGINGCAIALELAKRGNSVLILDKSTVGSGTSSKSSRLIHGGLRYLETFKFKLVREALLDRKALTELYPNLVQYRPFFLPVYASSPRHPWLIWIGLKLYDLLSDKYSDHTSHRIPKKEFTKHAPCLKHKGLKAVFRYYDGKTNDLALTQCVAEECIANGCTVKEHILIQSIIRSESQFTIQTQDGAYAAPILINATGPWIDEVNAAFQLPAEYTIRKISGIHIVVKGLISDDPLFMQTKNKRVFFIIPEPEKDHTLIGTTEREEFGPANDVIVNPKDVKYLLENINVYLNEDHKVYASDILHTFIGIRPLIAHKDTPTDLSREYALDYHTFGNTKLLHVFGGKLTTFLSLSKKAAERVSID